MLLVLLLHALQVHGLAHGDMAFYRSLDAAYEEYKVGIRQHLPAFKVRSC